MPILIQRLLYDTINTGLPDRFAGQHCANIGRKFSDVSPRSQKEIFFFQPWSFALAREGDNALFTELTLCAELN